MGISPAPTNGVAPTHQSMATAGATATKGAAVAGTAAAAAAKKYMPFQTDSDQKTEPAPAEAKAQPPNMLEKSQDSKTGSTSAAIAGTAVAAAEGAAAAAKKLSPFQQNCEQKTEPAPGAAEAQIPDMPEKTQDSKTGATPSMPEKTQDSKTGATSAAQAGMAAAAAAAEGAAAAAKKFSPFQKDCDQKTEPAPGAAEAQIRNMPEKTQDSKTGATPAIAGTAAAAAAGASAAAKKFSPFQKKTEQKTEPESR